MEIKFKVPFEASRQSAFSTPLRLVLATTAAFWMGAAQPQVAMGKVARQVTELRFRDFFNMPMGPTGLDTSDILRQADGHTVRLVGYMVQQKTPVPGHFILAPRPVQMSEQADGEADNLPLVTVVVYLDPSQQDWAVPHVQGLVAVNGTLSVNPPNALGVHRSAVSLQLGPDAVRGKSATEMVGYLHKKQFRAGPLS
jgi:hypothetical protein